MESDIEDLLEDERDAIRDGTYATTTDRSDSAEAKLASLLQRLSLSRAEQALPDPLRTPFSPKTYFRGEWMFERPQAASESSQPIAPASRHVTSLRDAPDTLGSATQDHIARTVTEQQHPSVEPTAWRWASPTLSLQRVLYYQTTLTDSIVRRFTRYNSLISLDLHQIQHAVERLPHNRTPKRVHFQTRDTIHLFHPQRRTEECHVYTIQLKSSVACDYPDYRYHTADGFLCYHPEHQLCIGRDLRNDEYDAWITEELGDLEDSKMLVIQEFWEGSGLPFQDMAPACEDIVPVDCGEHLPSFNLTLIRIYYLNITEDYLGKPWVQYIAPRNISLMIVNMGAHFVPIDQMAVQIDGCFKYMKEHHPKISVMYRDTSVGHVECGKMFTSPPLMVAQDRFMLIKHHANYHWDSFTDGNMKVQEIIKANYSHIMYVNVYNASVTRVDSHPSLNGDCLHYCLPGPIDTWWLFIYSFIVKTHELGHHEKHHYTSSLPHGTRHIIPDGETFEALSLDWKGVKTISEGELYDIPIGRPIDSTKGTCWEEHFFYTAMNGDGSSLQYPLEGAEQGFCNTYVHWDYPETSIFRSNGVPRLSEKLDQILTADGRCDLTMKRAL
eukprot:gene24362-30691_t